MISVTASTISATTPPPAFAAASRHHYQAARLAEQRRLWISADHLAGLAAECAIKAILTDFLGSKLNERNMPVHPEVKYLDRSKKKPEWTHKHGHLPELWEHLTAVAQHRRDAGAGALFTQLIWENPFVGWDVADRYCDGTAITEEVLDRHLKAAYDLIAAHEQARILGMGTSA